MEGPDRLERYRAKRSFEQTPEPNSDVSATGAGGSRFVVQKHDARRLHYDFRLEADGVLISWAVPKGPSFDPKVKRLAVHVEDHPLDYEHFEGVIPDAQYGAGTVIVWDEGTYRNLTARQGRPIEVADAVRAGHLSIWLDGAKLQGGWSLTRTGSGGEKESWLMVKRADDRADPDRDITTDAPDSVLTGRGIGEIGADAASDRWTRERATWRPPMLAQLVKPADHYRVGGLDDWQYERKLDGLRCLAVRNGSQVELWSRNHLSFNARFPGLVEALAGLAADNFTLDGEIVAFEGSRTSFARLQGPDGSKKAVFWAFDLLHLLGRDTTELPLTDRQALLAQVLHDAPEMLSVVTAVHGEPGELLGRACADGWEGLIAKRTSSLYQSGRASDWQKLKCTASQELVIAGWTDPSGSRIGFGALLMGYYDEEGGLRYAGKVGTGFSEGVLRELHRELKARELDDPPFAEPVPIRTAHWARPELVAAVAFTEWTTEGRLRHPSFQGLRPDKDARSVVRESPA
jgi:bifunctional non-homologous end joining protein LigD